MTAARVVIALGALAAAAAVLRRLAARSNTQVHRINQDRGAP